jgi:hypothetical protein
VVDAFTHKWCLALEVNPGLAGCGGSGYRRKTPFGSLRTSAKTAPGPFSLCFPIDSKLCEQSQTGRKSPGPARMTLPNVCAHLPRYHSAWQAGEKQLLHC